MARLEEVNTDDGKCSAHDDAFSDGTLAVQKLTKEPVNPDEVVDLGAAVQAATSVKNIVSTAVSRHSVNEPSRPCPSLLSHCRKPGPRRGAFATAAPTRAMCMMSVTFAVPLEVIAQNMIQCLFNEKEFNPDEASIGDIDKRSAHDVVFVDSIVQKLTPVFSLLDVTPFMELETAGGVMMRPTKGQTLATQADSQTGFAERLFSTVRCGHIGCTNEGFSDCCVPAGDRFSV